MKQLHQVTNSKELEQLRSELQSRLYIQEKQLDNHMAKFNSGWYMFKLIGSTVGNLAFALIPKINFFSLGLKISRLLFKRKRK